MKNPSLKPLTGTLIIAILLVFPLVVSSAKKTRKETASPAAQGSAAEGAAIFKKNCTMCHFPDKAEKKIGPGLKDVLKNKELPQSHKEATEANVREQIEKGSKAMPPFGKKLSPGEIESLLAYLKTL